MSLIICNAFDVLAIFFKNRVMILVFGIERYVLYAFYDCSSIILNCSKLYTVIRPVLSILDGPNAELIQISCIKLASHIVASIQPLF